MGRKSRQPEPPEQGANAFIEDGFVPGFLVVEGQENQPGVKPCVRLRQFVGPLGTRLFMFSKTATLEPKVAIAIGESLIEEGRRVDSSVEIPAISLPEGVDLREKG